MSEGTAFDQSSVANYQEQLVGDDKKYANTEELAKAYSHADQHIKNLEAEYAELKAELDKQASQRELLEKIVETKEQKQVPTTPAEKTPEPIDVEAIANKVKEQTLATLQAEKAADISRQNELAVDAALQAKYGEGAIKHLQSVAAENDMTVAELQQLAQTNPTLARRTLGLAAEERSASTAPIKGNDNQQAVNHNQSAQIGSKEYWDSLKASDPKKYFSATESRKRLKDMKGWNTF